MSKLFSFDFSKPDFSIDKPDFTSEYGTGTLSSQRPKETPGILAQKKPKPDPASIIGASADGVNSITGLIGTIMGKPSPTQQTTYNDPPPSTKKKVSPLLIGSIIGGVVLIIILIVMSNGKQSTSKPSK